MTSAGGVVTTRARTPKGSVHVGPVVWPDGKPEQTTGPRKSRRELAQHVANGDARRPARRSDGNSPKTSAGGARQHARLRQLRQHPVNAIGPFADVLDEQDAACAAVETPTACRAARRSWVSVPPTSAPRASPARSDLEASGRQLAHRLGLVVTAPRNERRSYPAPPRAEPALDHRPVKRRQAMLQVKHSIAVMSL